MTIPDETIRQVRDGIDIVEIVGEYVTLTKRGAHNYFGLCPFHEEKTPSFSVHIERQTFHCFGCGKSGSVFTFLMEMERIDFPDAVRRLAERTGIEIKGRTRSTGENEILYHANELAFKYYRHLLTQTDSENARFAREYLRERGIDEELENRFDLGISPPEWDGFLGVAGRRNFKPEIIERAGLAIRREGGGWYDRFRARLMFPIRNTGGRVVGFGGRILREDPEHDAPKYINSPETPIYQKGRLLYGLPQARNAIRNQNEAILVEGYTDLIALHSIGLTNTVASLGTALTSHQATMIQRFATKVTLIFDADVAGNEAAFRGADILIERIPRHYYSSIEKTYFQGQNMLIGAGLEVDVALLPAGEDPDSLVRSGDREAIDRILKSAEPLIDFKVGFFRRKGQLDTPQGRSNATRSILETLRGIRNPITRQFVLFYVTEELGLDLDEKMISHELEKLRRTSGKSRQHETVLTTRPLSRHDKLLQDLIWVLVRYEEYSSEVFSYLHSVDLGDHPLRPLFEQLEAAHVEGKTIREAELYDALRDSPEHTIYLSEIFSRPDAEDPEIVATIVREAPIVLRQRTIKSEIEALKSAIKQGNGTEANKKRLQELERERRNLSAHGTASS